MIRSRSTVIGCILACLAIVGLASSASAAVFAGTVGGGIHMQYGPQNAGGDYLGIASESYEMITDYSTGFWTLATGPTPDGAFSNGFVLLAFDPYTGQVWNNIPTEHQALDYAGYTGHAPEIALNDVDGGGDPISSDVVVADMGRGYSEDTVYITGVFNSYAPYYLYGLMVHTSADGGLLASAGAVTGERGLLAPGDEVRVYPAGDPAMPAVFDPTYVAGVDMDFTRTTASAYAQWWYDDGTTVGWAGLNGQAGLFGFEMDGIRGWMQLDFTTTTAGGVRLTEYYFDIPEPATMSLLAIGGIAALIRRRRK